MERLGYWNGDSRVELYGDKNGKRVAVSDWNGEIWGECWEVFPDGSTGNSFSARPVYRFEEEGIDIESLEENSEEWDYAVEIIDIEEY